MADLRALLDAQAGVVHRHQLLELGFTDNDIRRLVRQRRLVRLHPGVYVNHTGRPSWLSRAWAAVLFHGEAALCDRSALDLAGDPIHVAIQHPRNGAALPGVVLHRMTHLGDRVHWHKSPPRLRIEDAALDVAGQTPTLARAIDVIPDVCNRRASTPQRLLETLSSRQRTPRGVELRRALRDVADGTQSALEAGLVRRVLRPHGLPVGARQVRDTTAQGVVYRDMVLTAYAVAIELDGHAWHGDPAARAQDMQRDLLAAGSGLMTIRLGWPHVHQTPCRTAAGIAAVLARRGWQERARPCSADCAVRTAA